MVSIEDFFSQVNFYVLLSLIRYISNVILLHELSVIEFE